MLSFFVFTFNLQFKRIMEFYKFKLTQLFALSATFEFSQSLH